MTWIRDSRFAWSALIVLLAGSGCHHGPAPTTPTLFRAQTVEHRSGRVDRWLVNDSFDNVSARLNQAYTACFQQSFQSCSRTSTSTGGYCLSSTYRPRAIQEGPGLRAVGIEWQTSSYGRYHDGAFWMLADVEAVGHGQTQVTFYAMRYRYFDRFLVATQLWSRGSQMDCPSLDWGDGDRGMTDIEPAPTSYAPPPAYTSTGPSSVDAAPAPAPSATLGVAP